MIAFKSCLRIVLSGKIKDDNLSRTFKSDDGEEYEIKIKSCEIAGPYTGNVMLMNYTKCSKPVEICWKESKYRKVITKMIVFDIESEKKEVVFYDSQKGRGSVCFSLPMIGYTTNCKGNIRNYDYNDGTVVIEVLHYEDFSPVDECTQEKEKLRKENSVQPFTITRPELLRTCASKLFETGEFSDVTLSDGTTDIKAHKLILSVHSPVFAKMFQNPMKESLENKVIIEDISMDVLKKLLDFMYSEAIEVSDRTMVRELYIASEKYDIKSLREICSDVLKSMDITNVIDTLLLADLHSDEVLKQAALDFVTKHFSKLKAMEKWKNLLKENQALYLEALSYVVDKKL